MSEHSSTTKKSSKISSKKFKWIALLLLLLIALVLAIYWWKTHQIQPAQYSQWSRPVPVRVVNVQQNDLQLEIKAIGNVIPTHLVKVQSQVSGVLKQIYFQDGQYLKKANCWPR